MIIRELRDADLPALVALEDELFGDDAWSAALLASPTQEVAVLDDDGACVGYVITMTAGDITDLLRIAVAPAHRRHGHARALLAHASELARRQGAERVLLEVSAANSGAYAFYRDAGFERIDVRIRYYRDGSDAYVLERHLVG